MTGTIKFPSANAAAIPRLICFFLMMLSPWMEIFIIGNFLMAFATASINMGVNVRFSPSRFKNSSLTLFLQFQISVTSASIKLCTWAEVCTDSTIWCAINLPILLISMISSSPFDRTGAAFGFSTPFTCSVAIFGDSSTFDCRSAWLGWAVSWCVGCWTGVDFRLSI